MGVLKFDSSKRNRFAAAYSYRFEDLHNAAAKKFTGDFEYFQKELIFLESTDDQRYVLWADMSSVISGITVRPYDANDIGKFLIDPVEVKVTVYAQTRAEVEAGEPPQTGIPLVFRISTGGNPISYEIGVFEDGLGKIEIKEDSLDNPEAHIGQDKVPVAQSDEYFLGAKRGSGDITVVPIEAAPEILEWIERSFPEYQKAILTTLFADVRLIADVSRSVVKNVQLIGAVEYFWEQKIPPFTMLVMGSQQAALYAPDCPIHFSEAYIEAADLEAAQNSVSVNGNQVSLSDVKISHRRLVSGYTLANIPPINSLPHFSLWINSRLLRKTFDYRLGKNLGAMLGAHYADRKGPIKYWLSGAWIIEGIQGSLEITSDVDSIASLDIRFDGRTKFDALAYIDIDCIAYELGSFDGFHEQFDFTLSSRVFFSKDGKVIFISGFEDVLLDNWRSFIRTFIDRYNSSWEGLIAEAVAKYVVGQFIRRFIEGEMTKAMGSMSLEIFDFKDTPIFGDLIEGVSGGGPAVIAEVLGEGLEIRCGANG